MVALVVFGRHVGRPGLWRDEAATIAVVRRSFVEIFKLSGHVDLVHLAYYLVADFAWQINESVTAVRLISVVAMSLAAGMLVLIGRELGSVRLGTLAGLLLVVNPFASRYAQEARPFASATLVATVSTYLVLRLLQNPSRRNQLAYGASLVALGLLNVLALMLVLSHAWLVWWVGDRSDRLRWVWSAGGGLAVVSPFVVITLTQRGQVSWIERPHLFDLRALATQEFGSRLAPFLVVALLGTVFAVRLVSVRAGWTRWSFWPSAPARTAVQLGIGWAVLPAVVLFLGSQVKPFWDVHYLVFTLPGLALLLAGLIPGLTSPSAVRSSIAFIAPVLLIATLGLNAQITYRDRVVGHLEDLSGVSDYLGDRVVPGDAVLFLPSDLRVLSEVSPDEFALLDDVLVNRTPLQAANLVGTPIDTSSAVDALRPHPRVWLIEGLFKNHLTAVEEKGRSLLSKEYEQVKEVAPEEVTDVRITLWERRALPPAGS